MGLLNFIKGADINEGLQQYKSTEGAYLIDVREENEYDMGHIPGSLNLPAGRMAEIEDVVEDKDAPLFVYCLSGARSGRAVGVLVGMGYTAVTNIGGISAYKGELEK